MSPSWPTNGDVAEFIEKHDVPERLQGEVAVMMQLIAELEAELKNTEANEDRLADANKPLLARAVKAERDLAEANAQISRLTHELHEEGCDCDGCARYKAALGGEGE